MELNVIYDENKASRLLDLIRFSASLIVFLFHFYVPLPGYQVVMIFFVLSGYFISSSILKTISVNKWSWVRYLLNRTIRLWLVLLPSLILTFCWAKLQFILFGESTISNFLNWRIFLGNLFFLQGILVPEYGQNGPLWSLSYEFWYYILFPCVVLLIYSSKKSLKTLYALLILLIISFIGLRITEYFLVWLIGAIIPIIKPKNVKNNIFKVTILIVSFILMLISMKTYLIFQNYQKLQILPDLSIGITFGIFLYFIISFYNHKEYPYKKVNIPKQLAGFSYTLYLTHFPLAHLILTWRASKQWNFIGIGGLGMKIIIMISVLLFAWLVSILTEKQTTKVRNIIYRLIELLSKKMKRNQILSKTALK